MALRIGKIVTISDICVTRCQSQYPIKTVVFASSAAGKNAVTTLPQGGNRASSQVREGSGGASARNNPLHAVFSARVTGHPDHNICHLKNPCVKKPLATEVEG